MSSRGEEEALAEGVAALGDKGESLGQEAGEEGFVADGGVGDQAGSVGYGGQVFSGVAEEADVERGGLVEGERRRKAGFDAAGTRSLGHDGERAEMAQRGDGMRGVEDRIGTAIEGEGRHALGGASELKYTRAWLREAAKGAAAVVLFWQTAYWYQLSASSCIEPQGWVAMRASKSGRLITSACCGSRYLPAGLVVRRESSQRKASGKRVRKPEVGSAMKQRPPGRRTRKDLADDAFLVGHDEEEAGDDDGVNGACGIRKGVGVRVLEAAVGQAELAGAGLSAFDEVVGEIDARGANAGEFFGEAAGVKAGAAAELKQMRAGVGRLIRKERLHDLRGVIAEEVLAAERVEPRTSFEETIRLRGCPAGRVTVALVHSSSKVLLPRSEMRYR